MKKDEVSGLKALLKERHEFPGYHIPTGKPTKDDHAQQREWVKKYRDLDARIRKALGEVS